MLAQFGSSGVAPISPVLPNVCACHAQFSYAWKLQQLTSEDAIPLLSVNGLNNCLATVVPTHLNHYRGDFYLPTHALPKAISNTDCVWMQVRRLGTP